MHMNQKEWIKCDGDGAYTEYDPHMFLAILLPI